MTYNVFDGTLNLAQSDSVLNLQLYFLQRVHIARNAERCINPVPGVLKV